MPKHFIMGPSTDEMSKRNHLSKCVVSFHWLALVQVLFCLTAVSFNWSLSNTTIKTTVPYTIWLHNPIASKDLCDCYYNYYSYLSDLKLNTKISFKVNKATGTYSQYPWKRTAKLGNWAGRVISACLRSEQEFVVSFSVRSGELPHCRSLVSSWVYQMTLHGQRLSKWAGIYAHALLFLYSSWKDKRHMASIIVELEHCSGGNL